MPAIKSEKSNTRMVSVRINKEIQDTLNILCKNMNMSMSQLIRTILEKFLWKK